MLDHGHGRIKGHAMVATTCSSMMTTVAMFGGCIDYIGNGDGISLCTTGAYIGTCIGTNCGGAECTSMSLTLSL